MEKREVYIQRDRIIDVRKKRKIYNEILFFFFNSKAICSLDYVVRLVDSADVCSILSKKRETCYLIKNFRLSSFALTKLSLSFDIFCIILTLQCFVNVENLFSALKWVF